MVDRGENGRTLTPNRRVRIPFGRHVGTSGYSQRRLDKRSRGKQREIKDFGCLLPDVSKLMVTEKNKKINFYATHSAEFLINYRS